MFLILLSDIDTDIESDIISFTDDTRIYRGDTNGNENLQSDLDTVYLWVDQNNMQFNLLKFNFLSCSHHCPSLNISLTKDSNIVKQDHNVKDLGTFVSDDLSFHNILGMLLELVRDSRGVSLDLLFISLC